MTRPHPLHSQESQTPRALLLAVQTPHQLDEEVATSVAELRQLLAGLGISDGGTIVQKRQDSSGVHVIGTGKLEELKEVLARDENSGGAAAIVPDSEPPWLVVFDGELSPGQQRALGQELNVEVVDRTQVILSVFQRRARTRIAQLEIELARLQYEAARIRDDKSVLDKQAGGGGRGGRGHTGSELRKQELRRRVSALRAELKQAQRLQSNRRARREQLARVALVGYTNAGKSSWMRALTGSNVQVENALFATLDTTVRALVPSTSPRIVVADTVGFLRNLPNHLLASFRSTLHEALDADLLLVIVDAADPHWREQLEVTRSVLADVGADKIAHRIVLNKCDRLTQEQLADLMAELPEALLVSSLREADIARVHQAIVSAIDVQIQPAALSIPYREGSLINSIHEAAHVLSERFDETGVWLELRAKPEVIATWKKRLEAPG